MEQKSTKRIEYIDAMRGFAMILVVVSHIICFGYQLDSDSFSTYNNIFVKFRMPLFFFISGWVFYKANRIWTRNEVYSFLRNKFRVQIISTIVFFLLYAYVYHQPFLNGLAESKLGYWFTYNLFCFFCFYTFSQLFINKKDSSGSDTIILFVMLLIFLLSLSHSFFDRTELGKNIFNYLSISKWRYYVFFVFGTYVKKYFDQFVALTDNKYFIGIIISIFVLLLNTEQLFSSPFFYKFVFVVYGLLGIIVVFTFFRKHQESFAKETRVGYALQYIGKRTLDIYLIHYFIIPRNLNNFASFFILNNDPVIEFFVTLFISILVIIVCLVISNVIRLSSFLSFYLLGTKK